MRVEQSLDEHYCYTLRVTESEWNMICELPIWDEDEGGTLAPIDMRPLEEIEDVAEWASAITFTGNEAAYPGWEWIEDKDGNVISGQRPHDYYEVEGEWVEA